MSRVSHYFCVFCDFTCEEYDNAFDHYYSHLYVSGNCESCDYNNLKVYVCDASDLGSKCNQCALQNYEFKPNDLIKDEPVIHYWISKFLSYQKKLLGTSYEKLVLESKVCVECAVCRYLVEKYASNGGDMNQIQYISDNKVEHCCQHMRYEPNSERIKAYIAITNDKLSLKSILKLEAFIELSCDTLFTGGKLFNGNNDSVVNTRKIDQNSVIQDNECVSCAEESETVSHLSPTCEDIVQQSLAPIIAKLNDVRSGLDKAKSEIQINKSAINDTKVEFANHLMARKHENTVTPFITVANVIIVIIISLIIRMLF